MIAIAAVAFAAAQPALAESKTVSWTEKVTYNDLDLATSQGQKELDRRLDRAARHVCGIDQRRTATRLAAPEAKECFAQTKVKLKQQVAALIDEHDAGGAPVRSPAGAHTVP